MNDRSLDARVAEVRRFNRFYTQQIGVVREGLLDTDFSLAEARVLYELAHSEGPATATAIGRTLALDPGYLSRMLRSFEKRDLVRRRPSAIDARRSDLTLTRKGRSAFARLDASARTEIAALLALHSAAEQDSLILAMQSIQRILGPSNAEANEEERALELRGPRPGDMGWLVARHGELYAEEYDFDQRFEALVAKIVAQFMERHDPARERCWIATLGGVRAGSIMLVQESDAVARLRLLLVEPSARGRGVGSALVDACLAFARAAGYARVTLWTNAVLDAARVIYVSRGFHLVREQPHSHFGTSEIGQDWELIL
jgi:DNA-binding MarR family transcriptional regulator/GNAT superfamily N-acetyltransferase